MCGISGIFRFNGPVTTADIAAVRRMMDAQVHANFGFGISNFEFEQSRKSAIRNSKSAIPMDKAELEQRTKAFTLRVIKFVAALPKNRVTDVLGYQLLKAATSVGANYREANRPVSRNDFINKIGIVEKEISESQYWLELFEKADHGDVTERQALLKESGELLVIFTAIGKSAKAKNSKSGIGN